MIARSLPIDGSNVRDLDFDQPAINIGSHPESDITIAGEEILPFHATVILQDGVFHLTRLSPEAQVSVDGKPIHEETVALGEKQSVAIGGYKISFGRNHSSTGMHVSVSMPGTDVVPAAGAPANLDKTILVNVVSQPTEIQVTQSAVYELEVVNAGHIVASFSVSLQGIPAEWVEINPHTFNLNEHQRSTVTITVTPPRDPSSTAGKHSLRALISSPNYPGSQVAVPLDLLIEPYYEFSLGSLTPKQQNISYQKQFGRVRLPITNRGNGPADFTVLAYDDENGCSFDFQVRDDLQLNRQATFNVQAGSIFDLPIDITPLKRHVFAMRSKRYQYTTTVHVAQEAASQQVVSGSVTSHPLFGWWTIVLSMMVILLGLFVLVQPRIQSFNVAAGKDVIELGDTTKLEWKVSPFATRVNISNVDQAITYGQRSLTVAPKQSTTYELVAGNWLSGLLGLDQKKIQTVLVVPPSPTVNVFEVDNTAVARGKPVNVRWSVTQADKAVLTIGGVVYELSPEKFSGEQSVVLDKDSLVTLDARNASGNELRSYFINVTDPFIKVNSFIVWVRPKTAASTTPSLPLLAAARPDPSMGFSMPSLSAPAADEFIEKYVELVEDPSSDQGYTVKFYQPKRELAKGEQVMVEWDVLGTDNDTVLIAPFTEILPSKGRQPYFPQASMNFVLTAQSGEQKKLFMLPVTVFDGTPPVAPKIDIFKASPMSITGPGKVQFTWSISGEWTRIELSSGKGVVAKNMMPEGFKTVTVSNSDTFVLKAWNGTLSSSQALDITVNPALRDPGLTLTVSPTTGRFQVDGKVTVTIGFTPANLSPAPTGQVTVTDGSANCTISLPATSCYLVFKTASAVCSAASPADSGCPASTWETKRFRASFPGDSIYHQDDASFVPTSPYVIVEPSRAQLKATYFTADDTSHSYSLAMDSAKLEMNAGLDVFVDVQPLNTILADDKGTINVSICDSGLPNPTNCSFAGSAQVKVASTSGSGKTAGHGYADVIIGKLPKSGSYVLLLEYAHQINSVFADPIEQPVNIKRAKLVLSFSACPNPDNFAGADCPYNSGSSILFDLKTPDANSNTLIPLASTMPAPPIGAFTLSTPATPMAWTCQVQSIDGSYKLNCSTTNAPALESDHTYGFRYDYDNADPFNGIRNDYYMCDGCIIPPQTPCTNTFSIHTKLSSQVAISGMYSIKVVERIRLTGPGGVISINGAAPTSSTNGALTLTEVDGKDIFGVDDSVSTNCSLQNGKIVVNSTTAVCDIYLKHSGTYKLIATFAGNPIYNPSTSPVYTVTVAKQDQISAVMYGDGIAPLPPSLDSNAILYIQARVSLPTNVPLTALNDRKVLLTLNQWGIDNCTLQDVTPAATAGTYEVQVKIMEIGTTRTPAASFKVSCSKIEMPALRITLALQDAEDFDPVQLADFGIAIQAPNAGSMTAHIHRDDEDDNEMISSANTIDLLHFGQHYIAYIQTTSSIESVADYSYTIYDNEASIKNNLINAIVAAYNGSSHWAMSFDGLPASMQKEGTCGNDMAIRVKSYQYVEFYRTWTIFAIFGDPVHVYGKLVIELESDSNCYFDFDNPTGGNAPIGPGIITITMTANSADNQLDLSDVYAVTGVDKQSPTIALAPGTTLPLVGPINVDLPLDISISPEIQGGTPLPYGESFSPLSSCPAIETNVLSHTDGNFTVGFRSSTPGSCSSVTLIYNGNKYFNSSSYPGLSMRFQHTSTVTISPLPASFIVGTESSNITVTVADADAPPHATPVPSGNVTLVVNSSAGQLACGTDYRITGVGCTGNGFQLPLTSGTATFRITFLTHAHMNSTFGITYLGDSSFTGSTFTSSPFNVP